MMSYSSSGQLSVRGIRYPRSSARITSGLYIPEKQGVGIGGDGGFHFNIYMLLKQDCMTSLGDMIPPSKWRAPRQGLEFKTLGRR